LEYIGVRILLKWILQKLGDRLLVGFM
jgi:hypothetical protein